jgi:hypothetical protein
VSVPPVQETVRLTGLLKGHSGMTVKEFRTRWFDGHVVPFSIPTFKNLIGLRCNLVIQDALGDQPYDGTQDLWWPNHEAMEADLGSPERAEVSRHVRQFVDPFDLSMDEWVFQPDAGTPPAKLNDGPVKTPGVKVVAVHRLKPGLTLADLRDRWLGHHIPVFTMQLKKMQGLRCSLMQQSEPGIQACDALQELWWASQEEFDYDVESREGVAAHNNSITLMDSIDLVTEEYVFI